MMLDHLGFADAAKSIETAIQKVLANPGPRTPDLGGTSRTQEVTDAVLAAL